MHLLVFTQSTLETNSLQNYVTVDKVYIQLRVKVSTNQQVGIGEADLIAGGSPACGYYEQSWIQMKKDGLAVVLSFLYLLKLIHYIIRRYVNKYSDRKYLSGKTLFFKTDYLTSRSVLQIFMMLNYDVDQGKAGKK